MQPGTNRFGDAVIKGSDPNSRPLTLPSPGTQPRGTRLTAP